jgi:hypothetical protein
VLDWERQVKVREEKMVTEGKVKYSIARLG